MRHLTVAILLAALSSGALAYPIIEGTYDLDGLDISVKVDEKSDPMSATVSNHSDKKVTCTAQYTSGEQVGESKTFAVDAGKSETVPIDGPSGSGKVTGSLKCRAS